MFPLAGGDLSAQEQPLTDCRPAVSREVEEEEEEAFAEPSRSPHGAFTEPLQSSPRGAALVEVNTE